MAKSKPKKLTKKQVAAFREAAFSQYHSDGEIEVDNDAKISEAFEDDGTLKGVYVQAWVWVYSEDLENEK